MLSIRHYDILEGKGKITKKEANEKAEKEYEKYKEVLKKYNDIRMIRWAS